MVNETITAELGLALGYAGPEARHGFQALLDLDATLGRIVRSTSQPIVGQMRLTWWHDALMALDTAPPPAEPVLQAVHRHVRPHGVAGADLAKMIDGWELLLDEEAPGVAAMTTFGQRRGCVLFTAAAMVCGCPDARASALGEGWALADLALNLSDSAAAEAARRAATLVLAKGLTGTLPRGLRSLGALALLARADLAGTTRAGSPSRVARLLVHRLTGR